MWSCVAETVEHGFEIDRYSGEAEHQCGSEQQRQHCEANFPRLDLLAEIFRRAAYHETGDEDRENGEQKHDIEIRSHSAGSDTSHQQIEHRHEPANGRQ